MQWRAKLQKCSVGFWTNPSLPNRRRLCPREPAIEHLTAVDDDLGLTPSVRTTRPRPQLARPGAGRVCRRDARARHAHRVRPRRRLPGRAPRKVMAPFYYGDGSLTEMQQTIDEVTAEFGSDPGVDQALERSTGPPCWPSTVSLQQAIEARREQCQLALEKGDQQRRRAGWRDAVPVPAVGRRSHRSSRDLDDSPRRWANVVGETGNRSTILATLALVLVQLGRDGEAESALGQSRTISGDDDAVNEICYATTEGLLLAHRGDSEGSEQQFAAGLRIVASTEFLLLQGELFLNRSLARKQLGDTDGALTAARDALDCFRAKGVHPTHPDGPGHDHRTRRLTSSRQPIARELTERAGWPQTRSMAMPPSSRLSDRSQSKVFHRTDAPDLHVCHARMHSAHWAVVRDYLDATGDGRGDDRGAAAVRRRRVAATPSAPPAWNTLPRVGDADDRIFRCAGCRGDVPGRQPSGPARFVSGRSMPCSLRRGVRRRRG